MGPRGDPGTKIPTELPPVYVQNPSEFPGASLWKVLEYSLYFAFNFKDRKLIYQAAVGLQQGLWTVWYKHWKAGLGASKGMWCK